MHVLVDRHKKRRRFMHAALVAVMTALATAGAVAVYCAGKDGHRALCTSPNYEKYMAPMGSIWRKSLPDETWDTMRRRGERLLDGGRTDWWAGAVRGVHGDYVVACGPEGVAIAGCYAPGSSYGGFMRTWLFVPHWLLIIIALIGPASLAFLYSRARSRWREWRKERRARAGLCGVCRYNITGADHKVCPECGAAVPKKSEIVQTSDNDVSSSKGESPC